MSNIDKILRDSLADHESAPSHDAWGAVVANLDTPNSATKWTLLNKAAAILLLMGIALSLYMTWTWKSNSPDVVTTSNEDSTLPQAMVQRPQDLSAKIRESKAHELEHAEDLAASTLANTETHKIQIVSLQKRHVVSTKPPEATTKPVPVVIEESEQLETLTITYKSGAKEPENDKSGFQKFMAKAADLKNSSFSLADLRETKNDVYASAKKLQVK